MADIFHDFPIRAPGARVFEAVATPEGLDRWWTKSSTGTPKEGAEFSLCFGSGYEQVRFYHTGWPTQNEHWRISCYCWAMYLRLLRRYLEKGETVPYEQRLDA